MGSKHLSAILILVLVRQRASATSSLDLLESLLQSDEDGDLSDSLGSVAGAAGAGSACTGRRCSANDHCCSGTLCVDLDGCESFLT